MKYDRIEKGRFLARPNRFIAHVEMNGCEEIVHVKNTGRCAELFRKGSEVFVQETDNPQRKTRWDLIGVVKDGRMVNVDSQIPNRVVQEWIEQGHLFENVKIVRPETTYGNSRFDLYIEYEDKKAFVEVKGVTLEEDGVVRFPDAPSERAVKHVEELIQAVQEGYEAYVFFVIQMKNVRYFTPNRDTHPAFADALVRAKNAGVQILAYDCRVGADSIEIGEEVPVVLENPELYEMTVPLISWYRKNHRELPWRQHVSAYRVWVSEIMLQQTRVEAVKPYFERFLKAFPTVKELAEAEEDTLLKMWEGLGYYNRVRNMQEAAKVIVDKYQGIFPAEYDQIRALPGIGSYTAGAIASFAFGMPRAAVDGNVLRVVSRMMASEEDIMKASVRRNMEQMLEEVIPADAASDFNQGLIELGATICGPNGDPRCDMCPLASLCQAYRTGCQDRIPVRKKAKERRIEKRTVLIFQDLESVAIRKRPKKGLLAGMYEFPNVEGWLSMDEVVAYSKRIGLMPVHVQKLADAKHVFSHVEWRMIGYRIQVDELEKNCTEPMIFLDPKEVQEKYSMPAAFETYTSYMNIQLGQKKYSIPESFL